MQAPDTLGSEDVPMTHRAALGPRSLALAALAIASASCGPITVTVEDAEIGASCLEAMTNAALMNPQTNSIAANVAFPLDLQSEDSSQPSPYVSKQIEFRTNDGVRHYFAVNNNKWARSALIRLSGADGDEIMELYVIDRGSKLRAAGEIRDGLFHELMISDPEVVSRFRAEANLWRSVGPEHECGQ